MNPRAPWPAGDPLIQTCLGRLAAARAQIPSAGAEGGVELIYRTILRTMVCDSLEAAIDQVEEVIREAKRRGDDGPCGSRYFGGYTIFAPDISTPGRRLLAIQGNDQGHLIMLDDWASHKGGFRSVVSDRLEISAYLYAVHPHGTMGPNFSDLLQSIRNNDWSHGIAVAVQSKIDDDEKRDGSTWIPGRQTLLQEEGWADLFNALKTAISMCDLSDRWLTASEDRDRLKKGPISRLAQGDVLPSDAVAAAAQEIGRHLARVSDHCPDSIAEIRLRMLLPHLAAEFGSRPSGPALPSALHVGQGTWS